MVSAGCVELGSAEGDGSPCKGDMSFGTEARRVQGGQGKGVDSTGMEDEVQALAGMGLGVRL